MENPVYDLLSLSSAAAQLGISISFFQTRQTSGQSAAGLEARTLTEGEVGARWNFGATHSCSVTG